MRSGIIRLVCLLVVVVMMSSCYMNSYGRYHRRGFYKVDRAAWHHKHRHGGW